jgi:hypothetical protein
MRNKKKDRKIIVASNNVLLASVTKEMAKPRMAVSVQIKTDKRNRPRDREPI